MAKGFIKVAQVYSCNNKLQEAISKELNKLDCDLHTSVSVAKTALKLAFQKALNSYQGRAKRPELKINKQYKDLHCHVEDVIILNIYEVKNDYAESY